ncbi:MAG: hypothetical protein HDS11_02560 [Bacteroides sp.]|nr:hypothetical protein [Bacteroides sp.]
MFLSYADVRKTLINHLKQYPKGYFKDMTSVYSAIDELPNDDLFDYKSEIHEELLNFKLTNEEAERLHEDMFHDMYYQEEGIIGAVNLVMVTYPDYEEVRSMLASEVDLALQIQIMRSDILIKRLEKAGLLKFNEEINWEQLINQA